MFDITSRLNVTRTLGSTVMLGTMLFLSLPAATYALVPSPTLSLKANPGKVSTGGNATLSWASKNTKSCTASGDWSGKKSTSGYQTVKNITSSRTYKLTCAGTTKNVSATVKVVVISTPPPPPPPPPVQPVVGLGPQAHTGGMNESGKAFILELQPHSLRIGASDVANIDWAVQHGFDVLSGFGYGGGCDVETAAGRQCYADRAATQAKQVGNKAQYFQVWNEWNGGFGFGRNELRNDDGDTYTDLLCRTYIAVKGVRPDAKVVGGVIAGANEEFLRGMLAAGAADCMDVLDLHLYVYRQTWPGHVAADAPGSVGAQKFIQVVTDRHNLVKQMTGKDIPIMLSEVGFHNSGTSAQERIMADYVTEVYARAKLVPFIEGIWWYELRDHKRTEQRGGALTTMGLVRIDNTKKPAFDAFKAAAGGAAR